VSRLASGRRITAGSRIGGGGEAEIFAVREDARLALKRYTKPTRERHDKVTVMAGSPPAASSNGSRRHVQIAWPVDVVFSDAGAFEGFVMPRIDSAAAIQVMALYNPQSRHQHAPAFTWRYLLRTAINVATAVQDLHARGYVVGDLNESNVLVTSTALVTIVDCDSMQVREPDGRVFRSLVGKPEFMAPELVGRDLASTDRTPASDSFALAVLVYHLLMEGSHPFTGVWKAPGDPPPIPERIQRGLFALAGDRLLAPPSLGLPFSTLPPELRRLFQEAFRTGGPPSGRPTATRWRHELEQVEQGLKRCRRSEHHVFGGHLRSCPWCERSQQLFDPFPGPSRQNPLPSAPFTSPTAPPKPAPPPRPARPQSVAPPPQPKPAQSAAPTPKPARGPRNGLPPHLVARLRALAKALVGALLLALGTGAALVVMLQVDNGWLDKHARDRLPADPSAPGHWGPIVLAGAAFLLPALIFGLPLLHDGLVRLVPPLAHRRSAWQRRVVVTAVVAAMAVLGTQVASPGPPAGRIMVEQTLPGGTLAGADDFSSNRAGWSARKLGAGRAVVAKGSYHLLLTRPDALVIGGSRSLKDRLAAATDVRVDVRAVVRRGGGDPVFGIVCRYRDDRHYYLVGLTGNGRYRVDKRLGDRWVQLQGWRATRTVRPTGANRLQVACTGGRHGGPVMLALGVNGQRVTQVVDRGRLFGRSPTIADGSVALFVRSRTAAVVDVAFDDLAVRQIDRTALPLPGTTGFTPWRLITENA
jgi:hypothetical protein